MPKRQHTWQELPTRPRWQQDQCAPGRQLEQQMTEAKKRERAEALKVKELCKEFGFTAGMLKGALADGRKRNSWGRSYEA